MVFACALAACSLQASAQSTTLVFESESLNYTSSDGGGGSAPLATTYTNVPAASGGAWSLLRSDSVGDSITFTLPNVPAGKYSVRLQGIRYTSRAKFQAYFGTQAQGSGDMYYHTTDLMEYNLGERTFLGGAQTIKLTVTGRNSYNTTGYSLGIDCFKLIPAIDYYISPTGTGAADSGGTASNPWPITMLNNATARSRYKGKTVGLLDGTYNVAALHQANTEMYRPTINVEGGTATSRTVIRSINPRGALITAKNGAIYTGPTAHMEQPCIIGNSFQFGVSPGYVTFDGLRLTGSTSNPIRIGFLDNEMTSTMTPEVTVQNCEIFDCNATAVQNGGNHAAISINNAYNVLISNNYFHDLVADAVGSADHLSATIQWGSYNVVYEYNTCIKAGSLFVKQSHRQGQYNLTFRYNYVNCSGFNDAVAGIQDCAGTLGSPKAGTHLRIHNNVLIADTPLSLRRGGLAGRIQSESVEIYNNTCVVATSPYVVQAPSWLAVQAYSPGVKLYNNHFLRPTDGSSLATPFGELGGVCISANVALANYNGYDSSNPKWSTCTNGGATYPTAASTSLIDWRTRLGGTHEQQSFAVDLASIAATGSGPDYFKPAGAALGNGRSNGLSTGAICNIGGWGGVTPPSRIGCSF